MLTVTIISLGLERHLLRGCSDCKLLALVSISFSPVDVSSTGAFIFTPARRSFWPVPWPAVPAPVTSRAEVSLPSAQSSTGLSQSRPFPARPGKVMESAGPTYEHLAARHGQSVKPRQPRQSRGCLNLSRGDTPRPASSSSLPAATSSRDFHFLTL